MLGGKHPLGIDKEQFLREFIQADCASGGGFVFEVIRKGGNIDRGALMMLAGLEDLATLTYRDTTALHMLAEACDKTIRPAFIRRAGKKALADFYDKRGLPVLYTILSLTDLRGDDLKAIGQVFSRDELRSIKNKNRTGKSILEVYTEATQRLKGRLPGERNAFAISHAVKSTNQRGEMKSQMRSPSRGGHPATDIMGDGRRTDDPDSDAENTGSQVRYRDLLSNPLDDFGRVARRKLGRK